MSIIVSLTQAELDDAYHLAYFQCETAAIDVVRRILVWDDQKDTRDLLINRLADALHEVETSHMGEERYAALVGRLMKRNVPEVPA